MIAAPRLCSQCGYDVRGVAARCPECGFDLSLQPDVTSEIPWSFRRPYGRTRAFVRTVARLVRGGDWIGRVVDYPVSLADARRFRTIVATIISLPFIGGFLTLWYLAGTLSPLAYLPDPLNDYFYAMRAVRPPIDRHVPQWARWDILLPMSAGWTRPGVGVIAIWLTAFFGCGAHAYVFAPRMCLEPRRTRAYAFSYYLCGPLVLTTLPLSGLIALNLWFHRGIPVQFQTTVNFAAWCCVFTASVAALLSYGRLLIALQRTTLCTMRRVWLAVIWIPIGWLASAALGLGFVPWVIGYVWTMHDAFVR